MKQTVYYQEGLGNWKKRIDTISLWTAIKTEIWVYKNIILPYYWNRLFND